ncbi:MAG: hypothetical protein EZS28_025725 [Streblomastix strix]|uniref:Uncharacterized protein n=1 Tax=Streblomastix strix TaxID=222440 RepID=A0A5J4V8D4_9EUKA|nr:MAG: hypothetical protein EZS28_025725 [Streblomastix strix]
MANKSGGSGHKRLIFSKLGCFCFVLLIVCGISVLTYTTIPTFFRLSPKNISPAPLCADNQLEFCQINGRQQFSKFIWFIADGTSYQFVDRLEKHFSNHSKVYITHTERNRYSLELYKSWFAGVINDRMNYKKLDAETMFRSLYRNGIKSSFIGPMYIMNSLMKDSEWSVLHKVEDVKHDKKENDVLPWPFFFEDGEEGLNKLQEYLDDVSEQNASFIAYSTVSDNLFHKEYTQYKGKYFPESAKHGDLILQTIGFMKEWIDNHPDTLLIIASDHGYDEMVDHQCATHGSGFKNNTGWQMLYNPLFTPEKSKEMDSIDVVSTLITWVLLGICLNKQVTIQELKNNLWLK